MDGNGGGSRQPILGSVSRRTRSQWAAFYRNRHEEMKPRNHQHDHLNKSDLASVECSEHSEPRMADNGRYNDTHRSKRRKTVARSKNGGARSRIDEELDLIRKLVGSRCNEKYLPKENTPVGGGGGKPEGSTLPLKFKFEDDDDEQQQQQQGSCLANWEKAEIDSLFLDLELDLLESEIGPFTPQLSNDEGSKDIDQSRAGRCGRGEHETLVDEQIGVVCKYCRAVLLDIKHVLPPFILPHRRQHGSNYYKDPYNFTMARIQFEAGSANRTCSLESSCVDSAGGTVLDLIGNAGLKLYPHQMEGLEFLWRNIAGDIRMENLKNLPADKGRGCIISHAPGTGKTRLTIVFVQSFMRLYPSCLPVIIAPLGMLLTWEHELEKWNIDIKFHNLNKKNLDKSNKDHARLSKLRSWMMGGSILGISYGLFEKLAGENLCRSHSNYNEDVKKILLELPGLLVLDEGHTARSDKSLMWNTLTKVKTKRRVMLSGTPFQNNFTELYNTLCLVNPSFSSKLDRNKRKLFISRARDDLKKLRSVMDPFVHTYRGGILEKNLPGLKDYLILLKPTDLQKELLENISPSEKFLGQVHLTSLISIHPSLVIEKPEFSCRKRELERLESDPDAGAKTCFLMRLIKMSARVGERVLVFSQFIPPLRHIMGMITHRFEWVVGREVVFIDGDVKMSERQRLIGSFNDERGEAKVMLASRGACSEGISLVGASRVVLLDVVWNPSVERQAISRAYRLGQERVVHVYRLMTRAEVAKYTRQAEKERVSEVLFSPAAAAAATNEGCSVEEDKVLEAMVRHKSLGGMFERIIGQSKDSDFIHTLGLLHL